jgi:hypothetical protein
MNHFILNLADGDRARAASLLQAKVWAVGSDERHRDALAPGDLVLIHVARPEGGFIGSAKLATAVHGWTPSEAPAHPDVGAGGVELDDVEAWDSTVPLDTAVQRLDPNGSNPYVQANAAGFRSGVVRITADEYAAVVALSREAREP